MIRCLPFKHFLDHLLLSHRDLTFADMRETISELFTTKLSEQLVLINANNSVYKVNTELF